MSYKSSTKYKEEYAGFELVTYRSILLYIIVYYVYFFHVQENDTSSKKIYEKKTFTKFNYRIYKILTHQSCIVACHIILVGRK